MNKTKILMKNALTYFIGVILSKIMIFLMLPMYTSRLSTYEFGYIDLITTIISLLVPILTICIFDSLYRFILDDEKEISKYITIGFIVLIIGVLICVIGYFIIDYFFEIKYGMLILLLLISSLAIGLWQSITRARKKNKIFSIAGVINTIVMMIVNIILILKFNFKGDSLLIATFLANLVSIVFLETNIKIIKYFNISYFDRSTLKELIKYSAPLVPNTLNWWIMSLSDRLIISKFLGVNFNGIYAVANKFPAIINIFSSVFYLSWQDIYLNNHKEADSEIYYNKMFNNYIKLQVSVTIILILVTRLAIILILDESYQSAYLYIPLLYIGGIFNSMSGIIGTVYQANKDTNAITYTSICAAVINIVINLLLISKIGLHAASLSTMISFLVMFIIRIIHVRKYINIQVNLNLSVMGVILLLISLFIYYNNSLILLIFSICVAIIVFLYINYKGIRNIICKGRI